jgi:hypothetical protein
MLLLKVVTVRIEALDVLGSAVILTSSSGGKQVVIARSDIGAVRSVEKQLTVEMLHRCSSASIFTQMGIIMAEHYTSCQHSTNQFILNGPIHSLHFCLNRLKTYLEVFAVIWQM